MRKAFFKKNGFWPLVLLISFFLSDCTSDHTGSSKVTEAQHERKKLAGVAKLVIDGLPKGFKQRDYTLSGNGRVAYTTIQLPNRKRSFIIQIDTKTKVPVLAAFSGKFNDMEPMLAPGDSVLLFASDRPLYDGDTTRDFNLWYCKANGIELSDPLPFDTVVNTEHDEFYPAMNARGDLFFTATYPERKHDDIYVSRKKGNEYEDPVILDFCKNEYYEFNAWINPAGNMLFFTSYGRPGETGGGDLYYSRQDTLDQWGEPEMLCKQINTEGLDYCPFVKGDTLFFTSKKQDVSWETKKFSYLAEINTHADTTAIGEQSIYLTSLKSCLSNTPGKNK